AEDDDGRPAPPHHRPAGAHGGPRSRPGARQGQRRGVDRAPRRDRPALAPRPRPCGGRQGRGVRARLPPCEPGTVVAMTYAHAFGSPPAGDRIALDEGPWRRRTGRPAVRRRPKVTLATGFE